MNDWLDIVLKLLGIILTLMQIQSVRVQKKKPHRRKQPRKRK